MHRLKLCTSLCFVSGLLLPTVTGLAAQLADVVVKFDDYVGPAKVTAKSIDRYKLRIDIDPGTETKGLTVRVELPATGRNVWPAADVEVRNARGEAVVVQRSGLEWHKLLIPVPSLNSSYFVQAVEPAKRNTRRTVKKMRQLSDQATGLNVSVASWYDGRRAALSLRFDDSHPTHLTKAIPALRDYGFSGTFMVNPGPDEPGRRRHSAFQKHRAGWDAVAKSGDHEFANHTAHHRGASGDDEMEAEIGKAARTIWKMTPDRSKLMALNLGGGTQWATHRTLRYYLDKFHQFETSGSLGMDDIYGKRVSAFRRHLERHVESRGWCRIHFHSIGEGLSSSEANFRAALEVVKEHQAVLWIAGMADIYKYQAERNGSSLSLIESSDCRLRFRLSCQTDPELYDQPLTIEVTPSVYWPLDRVGVKDSEGEAIAVRCAHNGDQTVLRFELPPRTAECAIELSP
jgi:hypothetical protein